MTPENSYLVRHGMTEVGPEGENYPSAGRWAEPDLDHAAALMREVWEDQAQARARGARAREDIAEEFSAAAVGRMARERLKRVGKAGGLPGRSRGSDAASWRAVVASANGLPEESWVDRAEVKLTYEALEAARAVPGPKGLARRTALSAMRPYTHHQDELNRMVVHALRELQQHFTDLMTDTRAEFERLAQMENRLHGLTTTAPEHLALLLEGMRARPASTHPAISYEDDHGRRALGFSGASKAAGAEGYRGFEDIFRGGEEELREAQTAYVERFAGAGWVLDLGCGRGEFLDALRDAGIPARGADLDATMVARCREKGHEVEEADAAAALGALDDDSLPGAFAAQVVEHLGHRQLSDLLDLLHRKLTPGGIAVLETVNPHKPAALKAFWTDPTHHHPLFPEVLLALTRLAGFDSGEVTFPGATGHFDRDVYASGDYAVVVRKAGA